MSYKATLCGKIFGPRGELTPVLKKTGYYCFSKSSGYGNPCQTLWHRFVYEFWMGVVPNNLVVDHINGIKSDNRLTNLQAILQIDNIRKGEGTKLSLHEAMYIKSSKIKGLELAEMFNVSQQLICDIRKGRCWVDTTPTNIKYTTNKETN